MIGLALYLVILALLIIATRRTMRATLDRYPTPGSVADMLTNMKYDVEAVGREFAESLTPGLRSVTSAVAEAGIVLDELNRQAMRKYRRVR